MPHPTSSTGTRTSFCVLEVWIHYSEPTSSQSLQKNDYSSKCTYTSVEPDQDFSFTKVQTVTSLSYLLICLVSVSIQPPHCPLRLQTPSPPIPQLPPAPLTQSQESFQSYPVQTAPASTTWHGQGLLIDQTSTANSHHFWSNRSDNKCKRFWRSKTSGHSCQTAQGVRAWRADRTKPQVFPWPA